ncbi:hypothetical protein [Algibacter lectus]|uniref:Methyltransferase n=1 Tax=Algibacter lectus TaxID=221126 RepID=A0A090VCH6_9FLAO|nr:hypothetical protein [Algibacter lectus]MDO7135721.1 hypothetical protein [Algibacter lectus]MWW25152.1 hypothetical protein [Algibacter lectus]TDY64434.1 hypothetical protein DFQ06_1343 [Algibacter lectus]SFD48849.1 hypothetical protein SAMN04489722_110133 [Algibacter lectus]GAL61099.1 methyltransferase [Algibacter lectus]
MSEFKDFFERLQQSVIDDEFVKLTLSRPLRKSEGLVNVYMRLFVVEGKTIFQFKYRHTEEEVYKQFSLPEAIAEIEELLTNSFRGGTLFTLKEDLLLVVSKKKKVSYRENAPSFKNKLPDVPLES